MRTDRWTVIFEARNKLIAYIDALWAGRASAAESLENIYTERLAGAAKLSALLQDLRSVDAIQNIVKKENTGFPRDFLATDAGRQARSAFNLFARAATTLADYQASDGSIQTGPEALVGEQLSSVNFVMDYIQLGFDGQGFQVFCPIVIHTQGRTKRSGEAGFRDQLCETIGQSVRSINISDVEVTIAFDQCQIELQFGSRDATLPEPLIFNGRDHGFRVFTGPN